MGRRAKRTKKAASKKLQRKRCLVECASQERLLGRTRPAMNAKTTKAIAITGLERKRITHIQHKSRQADNFGSPATTRSACVNEAGLAREGLRKACRSGHQIEEMKKKLYTVGVENTTGLGNMSRR